MKLTGRVAVVTGGGRGIGRAIALAFAQEGADLCVVARTRGQIDAVAEEIEAAGRKAIAVECDVSSRESVETAVAETVDQLGRIDILVNNAGGGTERTLVGEDDPQHWARVIEVNLMGTYYFCRTALPHLRAAGGGTIINVGSGMGHQARRGNSSYNAAKAAVWMLTRCLAMEWWQDGITVNELIPGPVHTELTADVFPANQPHPSIASEWVKQPEDVVPLALFLAAQSTHGPTGQSFSLARRPF